MIDGCIESLAYRNRDNLYRPKYGWNGPSTCREAWTS